MKTLIALAVILTVSLAIAIIWSRQHEPQRLTLIQASRPARASKTRA